MRTITRRISSWFRRFRINKWTLFWIAILPYIGISALALLHISVQDIVNFIVKYAGQIALTVNLGYRIELEIEKRKLKAEAKNIAEIKKAYESEMFSIQRTVRQLEKRVGMTREEHIEARSKIETILIFLKMQKDKYNF